MHLHPLEGPRLKIRRAESELEALRQAEKTFRSATKYRIMKSEFNPNSGKYVYRVSIHGLPPNPEWGVFIGEIAHNLRSALDSLVYELALLVTKSPAVNTQFPIFLVGHTTQRGSGKRKDLIPHFEGMRRSDGRSMIHQLLPEHQARLEQMQPYKRGNDGRASPIYWLKEINNADKHRLIQVVGAKTGIVPFAAEWGDDFKYPFQIRPGKILKHGAKFGEASPGVSIHSVFMPLIAFWDGCPPVQGKAVVNTLRIISEQVSRVVEDFSTEF